MTRREKARQIERAIELVIRAARERGFLTEAEADYITDAAVRVADLRAPEKEEDAR